MRREIDFPPDQAPLRAEVHLLGAMVGAIVREQAGDGLFQIVETARTAAIRRREGDASGESDLVEALRDLPPQVIDPVVRAFSTYFQVVNLGETVHRIRRRREHERRAEEGGLPQRDGFLELFGHFKDSGVRADQAMRLLSSIRLEPVFTAHPTENTRRAILEKRQRIARDLVDRLDPSRPPSEEKRALARIRAEVTAAWQTQEHAPQRPTVADELEFVLFFLTDVVYRIVPPFYEELEDAFATVYGETRAAPPILRFASWVGGDMDGNPNVDADTIRATLARQRELILTRYREELSRLAGLLTQSQSRATFHPQVEARATQYADQFTAVGNTIPPGQTDMPYVALVHGMRARLKATLEESPEAYASPTVLLEDLTVIQTSLLEHQGENAGLFAVRRLTRRVETFGFHLATLDVRQDSGVHRRVVGHLLQDADFVGRPGAERTAKLVAALESSTLPTPSTAPEDDTVLEVFRAIGQCRERYGERAIGTSIVSMTQGPDDLLAVLVLARFAGLQQGGRLDLDVAPLFETVGDLEAGPAILRGLFGTEAYRRHLKSRDDHQMVMIGYSDSNKDGGIAASRWALHRAQSAMMSTMEAAGVDFTFFHGRGGTISRGGGKTHLAVRAAPAGSVRGRLRTTEQGEMIAAKYGLRGIAMRTLERALVSVARATPASGPADSREEAWDRRLTTIASHSREAYRGLVYDDPTFLDYFRTATPIDVIERMRIGSRPASRKAGGTIEGLRAIPWVFAWTQSRHLLPGWYGLGTALERAVDDGGLESLQEMALEWPFMSAMLADVEMVLAKADMPIAERYARLAGDLGTTRFQQIRAEFDRTVSLVLQLRNRSRLLEEDETLDRSIRLRNPYVDPMSLLQVDLLRRWRDGRRSDDELLAALIATINGIAAGLRNTG